MSVNYIKTIDPKLYDLNVFYEKDLYDKATNFNNLLIDGVDLLDDFIEWNKSKVSFDPVESQSNIFINLDKDGLEKYEQTQYKIFWFERYLTAITPVKIKFEQKLKDNIKIFKDISDSIGLLRNVEYLPDDSVLAIFDIDFNLGTDIIKDQLIPINYATQLHNKISNNSEFLNSYMSRFVTSMYRHNMYQLSQPYSNSKEPHGSNLVVDYYHYDRIYNIAKETLESTLTEFYGDLYDIILYYENYNPQSSEDNLQNKEKGAIEWTLEGLTYTSDYLKQEVGFYKNVMTTMNILGTTSI